MSTAARKILLATEVSAAVVPELRAAANVSARTGAPVRLVHVGSDIPAPSHWNDPTTSDASFAQKGRERLDEQIGEIEARGGTVADSFGVPGESPGHEVVELTRDEDVGLVVVGDLGLDRFRYASRESVPAHVVRDADCPVMVVRGSHFERDHEASETLRFPRTVLFATDGSRESALAARSAIEMGGEGSALHVIHVYQDDVDGEHKAREILDEQAGHIHEAGGTVSGVHPRQGQTVEEILKLGEELEAELVVVGGQGVGSMRELVPGTVSGAIVRDADRTVLVVRADREEKPLVDSPEVSVT